jgi:hypothetical protein
MGSRLANDSPCDRKNRSARRQRGLSAQYYAKVGFLLQILVFVNYFNLLLADFFHFWGILGIFGGQILGGSWGCETNSKPI